MWRFPQGKPLGVLVYVSVDDIDKTLEEVVKLGGKGVVPRALEVAVIILILCLDFNNQLPLSGKDI